jgi:hypothetical protein
MKKKILILILSAVCCLGFVFTLNREPTIDLGTLYFSTLDKDYKITAYEIAIYRNSELETFKVKSNIKSHIGKMKSFDVIVPKNTSTEEVDVAAGMATKIVGDCYSKKYTIHDLEGNVLEDNLENFNDYRFRAGKDIGGYLVKAEVKWGRKSNYRQCVYFFKINFVQSMEEI